MILIVNYFLKQSPSIFFKIQCDLVQIKAKKIKKYHKILKIILLTLMYIKINMKI